MRKLLVCLLLGLTAVGASQLAAENYPSVSLGGGQTTTRVFNGQTLEFQVTGSLTVEVVIGQVQPNLIEGLATRKSGGTSSGTLVVRWLNQSPQVVQEIQFPAGFPGCAFTLEGGDGDKRTNSDVN
jgi:hypothetical protein